MKAVTSRISPLLPYRLASWLQHRSFAAKTSGLFCPPALSAAISATVHRKLSNEENAAIERIERSRKDLLRSRERLEFIDYGAGSSPEARTAEEMARGVVEEITVGDVCRRASKSPVWALLLFEIVRVWKPHRCLEMGTCLGLSAAYIGTALKLNGRGNLVTLEGAPALASIARRNLDNLGLTNVDVRIGRFDDTLGPALQEFSWVDFVFIDGHHDETATKAYFERIRPYLSPNGVLIFDDINWSEGMRRAWRSIADATTQAYDLRDLGVWINAQPVRGYGAQAGTGLSRPAPGPDEEIQPHIP